jgi:hypothetical protein
MNKTAMAMVAAMLMAIPKLAVAEGSPEQRPNRVDLEFRGNASLLINTASGSPRFSFAFADDIIPDANNELQFRRLKPYLFHIRHKNWEHHYQINTSRREIYRVTGAKFGKMGGNLETITDVEVSTAGGSGGENPTIISLRFGQAGISWNGSNGRMLVSFLYSVGGASRQEAVLHETTRWRVCAQSQHVYHFKVPSWVDHWSIDTTTRQAYRVIGGEFGRPGGRQLPLDVAVRVWGS